MIAAVHAAGWLLIGLSVVGSAYTVLASVLVGRFAAPAPPALTATGEQPAVTLLKPLHGDEPGLLDNLRSFMAQDYAGAVQVVLGMQDPADPALGAARSLEAEAPPGAVTVLVDPTRHGANGKIANLVNMLPAARHDLIVLSDSDMRVGTDYLRRLVAALQAPGVGAVSCLYHGRAAGQGPWPRLSAMGIGYGFLPQGAVGVGLGFAKPVMGSTIAISRETLDRIGGFERFAAVLADDYELGRAVRALGLATVVPPFLVAHGCAERSFAELWRHEVRWASTIRGLDPAGYAGSVVTHPVPLALLGCALSSLAWPGWAALALALTCRLWLKGRVDRVVGAVTAAWWLLPARDILSACVFAAALVARRVDWRGARFQVGRGGELTPV